MSEYDPWRDGPPAEFTEEEEAAIMAQIQADIDEREERERLAYIDGSTSNTVDFSSIKPEYPSFLWEPYVRLGNLNLLSGDGGTGKTTVALMLAAALADGEQPEGMPGRLRVNKRWGTHSLILSFEDEAGELRHRLDGCGCRHPERVHTLAAGAILPYMTEDRQLISLVRESGAKLLVIDPVQAFLQEGADMNKTTDVRRAMEALRAVCRETGCAVLLLAHLNKGTGRAAIQRTSGSMDFVNAVRSALMVRPHPRKRDTRCLSHIKSNGAKAGPIVAFSIGEKATARFDGEADVSEAELALGFSEGAPCDSSPMLVAQLLRRVTRDAGCWRLSASELSSRPENEEGLSPVVIGRNIQEASEIAGIPLRVKKDRKGTAFYQVDTQQMMGL